MGRFPQILYWKMLGGADQTKKQAIGANLSALHRHTDSPSRRLRPKVSHNNNQAQPSKVWKHYGSPGASVLRKTSACPAYQSFTFPAGIQSCSKCI